MMSSVKLNDVAFTQNNFRRSLLGMSLNSSAAIQNNALTENNAAWDAYDIYEMSIIQLKNVAFTQNNFKGRLLAMISNCGAIIQNNILIENNVP